MTAELSIRCDCGQVQGHLSPTRGVHLRCFCSDCRGTAHHLGVAERVVDADGGVPIFVTTLGALRIESGHEQLACLRCTPSGPLRWYARCCNTPIANTLAKPGLPFLSVCGSAWAGDAQAPALLGKPRGGIFGVDAPQPVEAHERIPPRLTAPIIGRVALARLRGEHRRNPFHDADGRPLAEPELMSREQRAEAHRQAAG